MLMLQLRSLRSVKKRSLIHLDGRTHRTQSSKRDERNISVISLTIHFRRATNLLNLSTLILLSEACRPESQGSAKHSSHVSRALQALFGASENYVVSLLRGAIVSRNSYLLKIFDQKLLDELYRFRRSVFECLFIKFVINAGDISQRFHVRVPHEWRQSRQKNVCDHSCQNDNVC